MQQSLNKEFQIFIIILKPLYLHVYIFYIYTGHLVCDMARCMSKEEQVMSNFQPVIVPFCRISCSMFTMIFILHIHSEEGVVLFS